MSLGKKLLRVHQDLVLLAVRLLLGLVLVAHGWQKIDNGGLSGTSEGFAAMGVPRSDLAAGFAIAAELGGGTLILLGMLTPLAAVLVVGNMAGAFWFVHRDAGVFVGDGGWELVAVIAAGALALLAVGPGRLSFDGAVLASRRRKKRRQAAIDEARARAAEEDAQREVRLLDADERPSTDPKPLDADAEQPAEDARSPFEPAEDEPASTR